MTEQQTDEAREREIARLVDEVGYTREYWERVFEDEDLWILDPEMRFALEGKEAVRQWDAAFRFAEALSRGFASVEDPFRPTVNDATCQLLWDLRERAEEAFVRARERAASRGETTKGREDHDGEHNPGAF
jgi:hypothetical protein